MNSFPVNVKTLRVSEGPNQKVFYPQVEGMKNPQFERFINQTIIQETQELINQQIANMPTTVAEMIGLYEMKNNQRQVLSLTISNYTYHYQAAHGMTYIKGLTFDLEKKEACKLSDLFKPGSNYIERISILVDRQIKERDVMVIEDFETIQADQDFYLADKTLVIFFQLYQLAPYAFGFPFFPISVYDIQDILNEDGPLGRLAENN